MLDVRFFFGYHRSMKDQANLFSQNSDEFQPLPEQLRPRTLDDFVGHVSLIGKGTPLRTAIEKQTIPSMIFWGPPGSGKTTLAFIIANTIDAECVTISATSSGKKDLQEIVAAAKNNAELHHKKTIVFIDEIHRWNKAQQDALLPAVEKGLVTLIGATTENPSFSVNSALLSRVQIFVLKQHTDEDMATIIARAAKELKMKIPQEVEEIVIAFSNGDARTALNIVQLLHDTEITLTKEAVLDALEKTAVYDKTGEEHYNLISALHKSMRASDPDAALYWAGRMLQSGEDPRYLTRRIIRFASEDIGNSKPTALMLAIAAHQAVEQIGMPECTLAILQSVEYCARAPKSRAIDDAWVKIQQDMQDHPNEPVPMHLRNAPTKLMKELGYGKREQDSNLPANISDHKYI